MKIDTDTEAAVKRDYESHSSNKEVQELSEECRVFRLLAQAGLHTFRNMNHDVQNVVFELRQAMMKVCSVRVSFCTSTRHADGQMYILY
jgi:hypothetical protein